MKKTGVISLLLLLATFAVDAQVRYMSRSGKVSFYSDAPLEKIEGHNSQGTTVFDAKTGQFEFMVLMKAFEFEKALMEEHFNENYAESDKYPKTVFKGSITNISEVNFGKDGVYPVKYAGSMNLHGVTKDVKGDGTFEVKGGKVIGRSSFLLTLSDYNISIPSLVKDKVSNQIKVTVDASYDKM